MITNPDLLIDIAKARKGAPLLAGATHTGRYPELAWQATQDDGVAQAIEKLSRSAATLHRVRNVGQWFLLPVCRLFVSATLHTRRNSR